MLGINLESQSLFLSFFFPHTYATVKDNNFKFSNKLKALVEVFYFELKSLKTFNMTEKIQHNNSSCDSNRKKS